jgi:hypothetical protein
MNINRARTTCVVVVIFSFACVDCNETSSPRGDPCSGISCAGQGSCGLWYESTPYCICNQGFHPVGLSCEPNDEGDPCLGVHCGLHGQCEVASGSPSCRCDRGYSADPSGLLCFTELDDPPFSIFDRAPGAVAPVRGFTRKGNDLYRSKQGTFFVVANGTSDPSSIQIARSDDQCLSWSVSDLPHHDDTGGNIDLYGSRIFGIDEETIGVSAMEGTMVETLTYENRIRYSNDDGLSFNDEWIAASNFPGSSNDSLVLISDGVGGYVSVFIHDAMLWLRRSESLDMWPANTPDELNSEFAGYPSLARAHEGDVVFLAVASPEGFVLFESSAGEDFRELGSGVTSAALQSVKLHWDADSEELNLCGVAMSGDRRSDRVFVYRSRDRGASWQERLYLPSHPMLMACFIDETGTSVLYHEDGQDFVILPGEVAACGNGVIEPGEECDSEDLGGLSCLDYRLGGGGELLCEGCVISTRECLAFENALDCQDIQPQVDGDFEIDPDGVGPNPPFEVWCHFSEEGGRPRAYLTLDADEVTNFSHSFYERDGEMFEQQCFFNRVLLSDPRSLTVDGRDRRFAECAVDNSGGLAYAMWGYAWACTRGQNPDGTGQRLAVAQMNVDLTGTPFRFETDYFSWKIDGWMPSGHIETVVPGLIVEASGGGDCGGAFPDPQIRLRFAE